MERLVTTAQAAQILGLSLQGVHYRIKKNQLKSVKKAGKTYVYISEYIQNQTSNEDSKKELKDEIPNSFEQIIKVKNEQIELLKKSLKWVKKQYSSEIYRLEKNQDKMISVFNAEIELLQSAFNEMQSIYKQPSIESKQKFISLQEFTIYLKKHNKSQKEIKETIIKAIKNQDNRFIYDKEHKKLLILNEDFSDLI